MRVRGHVCQECEQAASPTFFPTHRDEGWSAWISVSCLNQHQLTGSVSIKCYQLVNGISTGKRIGDEFETRKNNQNGTCSKQTENAWKWKCAVKMKSSVQSRKLSTIWVTEIGSTPMYENGIVDYFCQHDYRMKMGRPSLMKMGSLTTSTSANMITCMKMGWPWCMKIRIVDHFCQRDYWESNKPVSDPIKSCDPVSDTLLQSHVAEMRKCGLACSGHTALLSEEIA